MFAEQSPKHAPTRAPRSLAVSLLALAVAACANAPVSPPSAGHLNAQAAPSVAKGTIPTPVQNTLSLPRPKPTPKVETYSVVVNNVRVQDLLFALARDAKVNVDIHPGIEGLVTLNAIDQTLPQLLTRIAKQVDMRWEMNGPNLSVMPDKPYLHTYKIDFLNMARSVKSTVATATQIASAQTSGGSSSTSSSSTSQSGNVASTSVTSDTKNDLMESLISNVTDMLKEEDRIRYRQQIETEIGIKARTTGDGTISAGISGGTTAAAVAPNAAAVAKSGPGGQVSGSGNQEADSRATAKQKIGEYEPSVSVFANKETGVLIVRATSRQHEKVQQFIDQVMRTAKRQVLIEATIIEVTLNDAYKQGINWAALPTGNKGFSLIQAGSAGLATTNPLNILTLAYANATSRVGNISAEVSLLESFGNVRVLSSPKMSVMNNQTATLKVADSKIYFTVEAKSTTNNNFTQTSYTSTPNAISVGFMMNVTPHIDDADEVTLNIRPTITRITGYINDPNPALASTGVVNRVPEIQTREMESIIRIGSGNIAVMGGLMQDEVNDLTDAVPTASQIPIIGNIFKHKNDKSSKTELVIFLRPIVIKDASLDGDYAAYRGRLPGQDFFDKNPGPDHRIVGNPTIGIDGGGQ